MMGTWRETLLLGLPASAAEATIRKVLADRADRSVDRATAAIATTWREWTTVPRAAPTLAWSHQTVHSGLPVSLIYTQDSGPWDPELPRLLSARSGGYVLAGEQDSRRSTWGLLLCHDGRVVRWRRQAQEPGTESGLGVIWDGLWARAVEEVVGTSVPLLAPDLLTPLETLPLPSFGGHAPALRPTDDTEARWYAVLVDVEPARLDQLVERQPTAVRLHHGLADPALPSVSARFSVARGSGRGPPAALTADLQDLDPEFALLLDDEVAEPQRLNSQAKRLQSAAGIFVVPAR